MSNKKNHKLFTVEDCENLGIQNVHELYKKHVNASRVALLSSFGFGNDLASYSQGAYIYTRSKKKILDFTGGIGVLNHGHNHPRIIKVRKKFQEDLRMEVHRNFFSPYIAALGHNISAILPGDLNYSFFVNSGSESVEWALKTAFKYHNGNRNSVLYSDIAFHGKLFGSESVTSSPENSFNYPKIAKTYKFKFNNIDSVISLINKLVGKNNKTDVAAIIVEPFNVSNLIGCRENFLRDLRDLCTEYNIVLIFDEVYSGWCKTGPLFNFMQFDNIIPDVLCTAKSIGGGKSSIAGLITRKSIFKKAFDTPSSANLQTTTYYGFGEETVTAIEAINIIKEENFEEKAKQIQILLERQLNKLKSRYPKIIKEIRGSGAIFGLFIKTPNKMISKAANFLPGELFRDPRFVEKLILSSIINDLYENSQILTFTSLGRDLHLIISPPLIVNDDQIQYFVSSLDKTLSKGIMRLVSSFAKNKLLRRYAK